MQLTPGQPITLIRVEGLGQGASLAIQTYRGERLEMQRVTAEIEAQLDALRETLPAGEYAQVSAETDRLLRIDLSARRPRADQLALAAASLGEYRQALALTDRAEVSTRDIVASARRAAAGVGGGGRRARRSSRWLVSVLAPGGVAPGHCRLVWSVGGFTGHPGSVERETLPLAGPLPVPPADLVAWVERGGRVISDELPVRRAQLQAIDVREDTIRARERCDR